MPDDELTREQESRAIELIRQNWGADFDSGECVLCKAPALTLMGGELVCSTTCALALAEGWIDEASNRCELANAAGIYSDLEDLIGRGASEVTTA